MEFKDRVANKPNRVKLTYEDSGASSYATVELADEPIENGTPLNKATFDAMQNELNAYVDETQNELKELNAYVDETQNKLNAYVPGNVLITSTNRNPAEYLGVLGN